MAKQMKKKRTAPKKRAAAAKKTTAKRAIKRPSKKTARRKTAARAAATRTSRQAKKSGAKKSPGKKKPAAKAKPSVLGSAATAVKGALAGAVSVVTRRLPADTDAIALLEKDHRRLETLLKQGEETTERAVKGRTDLLETITVELGVHELIEEKLLYPALKKFPEARDIVLEGFEEHHVADLILKELHEVAKDDEQWGAKFKVLKESIEHHIQEEEGDMFRKARGVMSQEDLAALGREMAQLKRDAEAGRLPK